MIRASRVLWQGSGGGMGGAGVTMSPFLTSHKFAEKKRGVIQPSIGEISHKMDQEAWRQRQQNPVALALQREFALQQQRWMQDGQWEEQTDEEETVPPPIPRQWRSVPRSLLSTARTQQDWFRLMHFNMMVDRWSDYYSTPTTFSATQTTRGSKDSDPLPSATTTTRNSPSSARPLLPYYGAYPTTSPVVPARIRVPTFLRRDDASPAACPSVPMDAVEQDNTTTTTSSSAITTPCGSSGYEDFDPALHDHLPPYLSRAHRRQHLVQLLQAYDPDVITLNEVNREFFFEEIFKFVRYLGYGALYQSSRGARVKPLRRGDDPLAKKNKGKIGVHEDIGNVILFHKGRFVPVLSGGDYGKHFHYAHFANLRDRVTNLNLLVACVQLTAGNTALAREVRAYEANQVTTLLDAFHRYDTDRSHQSVVVCGDLNNESMEEECVEIFRNKLFSTYDLAGGPRWTTWHYAEHPDKGHRGATSSSVSSAAPSSSTGSSSVGDSVDQPPANSACDLYTPYFKKNVEEFWRCDSSTTAQREMALQMAYRQQAVEMAALTEAGTTTAPRATTPYHEKASRVKLLDDETTKELDIKKIHPWTWLYPEAKKARSLLLQEDAQREESRSGEEVQTTTTTSPRHANTETEVQKNMEGEKERGEEGRAASSSSPSSSTAVQKVDSPEGEEGGGVAGDGCLPRSLVRRTQDFIFYDPNRIALHQLLDVPDDEAIHPQQLLPCTELPSHHVPLVVDISFNNRFPDVGETSTRE